MAALSVPSRGDSSVAFAPALARGCRADGLVATRKGAICGRSSRAAVAALRCTTTVPASGMADDQEQKQQPVVSGRDKDKIAKTRITSVAEFRRVIQEGGSLTTLEVVGDTTIPAGRQAHPVLKVLAKRRAEGSKPLQRSDKYKVALAIEGGGMRGCVAAGMASALADAGLADCFDEVYGSSAGSLVGAYWIANSFGMVQYGASLYYDLLTGKASKKYFIDKTRALTLLGFDFLRIFTKRFMQEMLGLREKGLPLLNLQYLLRSCVEDMRPLDWQGYAARDSLIPLHIIASDVVSKKAVCLSRKNGDWTSIRGMTKCMTASMNLPAIAGPLVQLDSLPGALLADAQLFEPVPFKSALANGCTHVLVLRTRPDGIDCMPRPSKVEAGMMRNFFADMTDVADYLVSMKHKEVYCEDVLRLNEATLHPASEEGNDAPSPQLLTIALPEGVEEIGRLERGRDMIFGGVKQGYASAVRVLTSQPGLWPEAHAGLAPEQAADRAFPADLLEEEPSLSRSAWFDTYLRRSADMRLDNTDPTI